MRPDLPMPAPVLSRRGFLRAAGAAVTLAAWPGGVGAARPVAAGSGLAALHRSLSEEQRAVVCFPWDHCDPLRGRLRRHVASHWQLSEPSLTSSFWSAEQRHAIGALLGELMSPAWRARFAAQQRDDAPGPLGAGLSLGIFGEPERGAGELVVTGRHLTLRLAADGEVALATTGPVLYGHSGRLRGWSGGCTRRGALSGNLFAPQARAASALFAGLDECQRALALAPGQDALLARGTGAWLGLPLRDLPAVQLRRVRALLRVLLAPLGVGSARAAARVMDAPGRLEACSLAFHRESESRHVVWDQLRLQGPGLVLCLRALPHVHVWLHASPEPPELRLAAGSVRA